MLSGRCGSGSLATHRDMVSAMPSDRLRSLAPYVKLRIIAFAKIVRENIAREARLHTDESNLYPAIGRTFDARKTVKHSIEEYVRYEDGEAVHTNSAEGYFSIFKRGMRGVYQHCKEKHLHRYLAEYDFPYNHRIALGFNDRERAALAVKKAAGKRLTYRGTREARF